MALSHNDCLELREHGFPFPPCECNEESGYCLYIPVAAQNRGEFKGQHPPILEELIAECLGDRLDFYLNNSTLTVHWSAGMNGHVGNGSTPSQAVKNLYISLYAKKT